jgi:hypothetical protein
MSSRLSAKAYSASKLIGDSFYKSRFNNLVSVEERGFALLLYWSRIEVALKLMRYEYCIGDGWPDKLCFLGTTWKPLQMLRKENYTNYDLVFGKSSPSLYKVRNLIAHEGCEVSDDDFRKYTAAASWVLMKLVQKVPNLERLREKKRRSDAQLVKRMGK